MHQLIKNVMWKTKIQRTLGKIKQNDQIKKNLFLLFEKYEKSLTEWTKKWFNKNNNKLIKMIKK